MKKTNLVLGICLFLLTAAMGQEPYPVVNGVLQGSPTSFMYLDPQTGSYPNDWNYSWVKPKRYYAADDFMSSATGLSNTGSGATLGAVLSGNAYTHKFLTTTDSTVNPTSQKCFRTKVANGYIRMRVMPKSWNSDLYPGTCEKKVIQIGGPDDETSRGLNAQEMLYSFIPDTNNPVLLLQFAFATEGIYHGSGGYNGGFAPRNPGIEFALLAHGTNNYLPLGNYDATHPYSQFFYGVPKGTSSSESVIGGHDPRNTPVPPAYAPKGVPKGECTSCSVDSIYTLPYTIVAFNLINQARAGQAVDFRVREWACLYNAHWAFCYFTAKMIPDKIQVKYCGGDTLRLAVPWGFSEGSDSYVWYTGRDAADVESDLNLHRIDVEDPFNPAVGMGDQRVLEGSTRFRPKLRADSVNCYYRCDVKTITGIPMTYETTVNYSPNAVEEWKAAATVSIYPNPTTGNVTLNLSGLNARTVELFSMNGQLLHTVAPTGEQMTLSLSQYANGIYFVRIHSDKGVSTQKIVKK